MGGSILSDKNAKCSESKSQLPTKNLSNSDSVHSHFKYREVEISFLSILRFFRSKSTHPSLRYICYVGRILDGSIFIKQDRNNPCVLLTHSLNSRCAGLQCPASVYGHVNLTSGIQNVLVKRHDCLFSVCPVQRFSLIPKIFYYLQQTCPILIRSTLTLKQNKSSLMRRASLIDQRLFLGSKVLEDNLDPVHREKILEDDPDPEKILEDSTDPEKILEDDPDPEKTLEDPLVPPTSSPTGCLVVPQRYKHLRMIQVLRRYLRMIQILRRYLRMILILRRYLRMIQILRRYLRMILILRRYLRMVQILRRYLRMIQVLRRYLSDSDPEKILENDPDPEKILEDDSDSEKILEDDPELEKILEDDSYPEKILEDDPDPEKRLEDDSDSEKILEDDPELEKILEDDSYPEKILEDDSDPEKVLEDDLDPKKILEDNSEREKDVIER
eukprot:sb/3464722/